MHQAEHILEGARDVEKTQNIIQWAVSTWNVLPDAVFKAEMRSAYYLDTF